MEEILNFEMDDPESEFKFSDRLARENLWTKIYALRCIEEYKRFMYLTTLGRSITPSVQVDEVWHLHLLYSRSYKQFCELLGKFVHHGPTKGGQAEDTKYMQQYEDTLDLYNYIFGNYPVDIWPPAKIRFAPQEYVRVDILKHYIIPVKDKKALFKLLTKNIYDSFLDYIRSYRRGCSDLRNVWRRRLWW